MPVHGFSVKCNPTSLKLLVERNHGPSKHSSFQFTQTSDATYARARLHALVASGSRFGTKLMQVTIAKL
jgi:hypothetical protein